MKRLIHAGIAALLLAGCATQTDRIAWAQRDAEDMIAIYGPACVRLGYKADSDGWRDCILRMSTRDAYRYSTYPWTASNCFGPGYYCSGW